MNSFPNELETLREAWSHLDQRVSEFESTQRRAHHSYALNIQSIAEIIIAGITLWLAGGLLGSHFNLVLSKPWGAVPALAHYALSIATISLAIRRLVLTSELKWDSPVSEAALRVAKLERLTIRTTGVAFVAGLILWIVFPVFIAQVLFGYEMAFIVPATYWILNMFFGLVVAVGAFLLLRKQPAGSKLRRGLEGFMLGTALARARDELQRANEFKVVPR
ncbi:MAG: hypothetical protein LCH41_01030 [Armatimonadetes bacterium]|nr:hypothetical protein [Armatimonadota bacterium]